MVTTLHNPARTWTDNTDSLTAALLNQELRDNFNFLQAPPFCKVGIVTPPSIPNNSDTLLAWTQEFDDLDNMHDNVTNNSRIVVPVAGVYRVRVSLYYSTAFTQIHDIKLKKNGAGVAGAPWEFETTFAPVGNNDYRFHLYHNVRLVANDYLEVFTYQNSGVAVTLTADGAATGHTPSFSMRWTRV